MSTSPMFAKAPSHGGEIALSVKNLCVDFPTDDGVVHAVRDISFDLAAGEVLGVVGESGSGKSVSSMAVMGLLPKNAKISGSVQFGDSEIVGMSDKQMRAIRGNGIAMIFQDPMTSLNPVYTIGWQLAEAYQSHHKVSKQEAAKRVLEVLDIVGIPQPDRRAKQYPHEFSGGMRQRAMIAMGSSTTPRSSSPTSRPSRWTSPCRRRSWTPCDCCGTSCPRRSS